MKTPEPKDLLKTVILLLCLVGSTATVFAETKYRQRFNLPQEAEKPQTVDQQKDPEKTDNSSKPAAISEMEKQQKILERFKPLIKPRSYDDLLKVTESAPALQLNRLPELEEAIVPDRAPNIRLTPYLLKSFAHPAYKARYQLVDYYIAVNCEGPGSFDDCSTTPQNAFKNRKVYVKFLQTSDPDFRQVKGMKIGDRFSEVSHLFADDAKIHGDGECLKTAGAWLACFDARKLAVNKNRLQMMPARDAQLLRFLKVQGRGY